MTIRRSLAPLALFIAPALLADCSGPVTPDPNTTGGSAGTGNPTSGTSGTAGSAAGNIATGGSAGSASGAAGVAGSSAGTGTSGTGTGGAGGSSGGAGVSGTGGAPGGAGSGGGGAGGMAGGGAGGAASGSGGAASGAGGSGGGGFVLTSSKIVTDMEMPADFTCAGDAHSPPLAWSGVPAGTMSFAMVFVDTTIINASMTDARGYHSAIWDIPANVMALPENIPAGASITTPVVAKQFNPLRAAYLGPCPNNGANPADVYEFRLFALPVATLTGQLNNVRNILMSITAAGPLGTATLRVRSDATGTLK